MNRKLFLLMSLANVILLSAENTIISYNVNGINLYFRLLETGEASLIKDRKTGLENYIVNIDTLIIPPKINYDDKEYSVTRLEHNSLAYLSGGVKVVALPASIDSIYYMLGNMGYKLGGCFIANGLESIKVDKNNNYYTDVNGVLYNKSKEILISYPSGRTEDSLYVEEGVTHLASNSIIAADKLRYLELPLSLKKIATISVALDSLKHLTIKDNVDSIYNDALYIWGLKHLTLGMGLKSVGSNFINCDSALEIYCRPIVPPTVIKTQFSTKTSLSPDFVLQNGHLYVPRKSLNLYRQAEGWKDFHNIYPIEPPIIAGLNDAEVSWVQNFSATGYVWTLYLDEAHTQQFVRLEFDKDGHLALIEFSQPQSSSLPRRASMHRRRGTEEEDVTDNRLAEYYSFKIGNLSIGTQYYYIVQSLSGDEVIDEESGSFTTQGGTPTAIDEINSYNETELADHPQSLLQKVMRNGTLYIFGTDGRVYNANGELIIDNP